MLELADWVLGLTNADSKIEHRELPQDDRTQHEPDIAIARWELGWEPIVQIRK